MCLEALEVVALSFFCTPLFCIGSIRMLLEVACFADILGNMSTNAYSGKRMAPDTHPNLFQTKE